MPINQRSKRFVDSGIGQSFQSDFHTDSINISDADSDDGFIFSHVYGSLISLGGSMTIFQSILEYSRNFRPAIYKNLSEPTDGKSQT